MYPFVVKFNANLDLPISLPLRFATHPILIILKYAIFLQNFLKTKNIVSFSFKE